MMVLFHHQEGEKGCWSSSITMRVRKDINTLPHQAGESRSFDPVDPHVVHNAGKGCLTALQENSSELVLNEKSPDGVVKQPGSIYVEDQIDVMVVEHINTISCLKTTEKQKLEERELNQGENEIKPLVVISGYVELKLGTRRRWKRLGKKRQEAVYLNSLKARALGSASLERDEWDFTNGNKESFGSANLEAYEPAS
ncbi:hypothetical protein MA16_Dca008102 [Dendrobium catenatum]|uniref:Uncharacterized protein n=1 Tax=Dendrobium catenatum TaxID=906689 RepID=A0A2I0WD05_9ASPA|nr:hypothetical protein MA16_Dca008102 [Dendrobium catenatum]